MNKFKKNDIIARCYDSGRVAICLYIGYGYSHDWLSEIYLGEDFYDDGGLSRFNCYTMGDIEDKWCYRLATVSEVNKIIDELVELRNNCGNLDLTHNIGMFEYNYLDSLLLVVMSKSRKEKLKKLKKISLTS